MKEIILSDHVGDQIRKRETKRQRDFQSGMSSYRSASARRKAAFRRRMPFLIALFAILWAALFFALWRAAGGPSIAAASNEFILTMTLSSLPLAALAFLIGYRIFMPRKPRLASAGDDESIWRAGQEGEDRLAEAFRRDLGDEWTLLKGYKNPGGEIDQILVGPPGVIAIEIKNYTGRVHIDGDRWTRDRYDNYGNLVGSGEPMTDRGGRSPSDQVNASADILQRFLDRQSSGAGRVSRAVVLTHDKAELGRKSNPSVTTR